MNEKMIAVCGLDCAGCPIHKASLGDVEAAQLLVGWWKGEGWLKEDERCELFPCGRLSEWAEGRKQYAEALKRLQQMEGREKAGEGDGR